MPSGTALQEFLSALGVFALRVSFIIDSQGATITAGAVRKARTLRREVPSTASAPREADDYVLVKTAASFCESV
jgi:hypothetical protein